MCEAPQFLLVSSYTQKLGNVESVAVPQPVGITVFKRVPPEDGKGFGQLVLHKSLEVCPNPSYICANRARDCVYAVSECAGSDSEGNLLLSFGFEQATGELSLLGQSEIGGSVACHVQVSPDQSKLAVASYMGKSVTLFGLADDGCPSWLDIQQHEGPASHANPERQEAPHPHMVHFHGRHLLVTDLGLDTVFSYVVPASQKVGEAALEDTGKGLRLPAGSGPRHLAVHPSGRWVYVLTELLSTVVACSYDIETGALALLDEGPVSTLPEGVPVGREGKSFCAAVRVSSDGRYLYTSNRGHDSIAVFALAEDGRVGRPIQWISTKTGEDAEAAIAVWPPVNCPRDFILAGEAEQWLIVANQDADTIVVLERCPQTGLLSSTNTKVACPAPVCLLAML